MKKPLFLHRSAKKRTAKMNRFFGTSKPAKYVVQMDNGLSFNQADNLVAGAGQDEPSTLQRRWGYFFCRNCLHGWVSSNVWCVQGSQKVRIK